MVPFDTSTVADRAVAAWARPGSATEADSGRWWARLRIDPGSPALRRHGLGLLLALATLAVLSWGASRPALWIDESASVLATQRTWTHLWLLLRGTDAPLVPYYVVLKALTGASTHFFPQLAAHPEVLYRWPSVLAMVITVWVLAVWLARFCPPALVLGIGAVVLATSGISRYGQEARPYPFIVMFAVICTALWTRLARDGRWRHVPLYAVSLALLAAANSLAASLAVAHLAAAVVAVERGGRWRATSRTVVGGLAGGALAAPVMITAARHGGGATFFPTFTPYHLFTAFVGLFSTDKHPFLFISPVLVLSALGLVQVLRPAPALGPSGRFVARLAACWAVLPPIVLLPAVALRPNLLIGRYLLFTVPGWTILGGLGLLTVAQLGSWLAGRVLARRSGRRTASPLATAIGVTAAMAVLIGVVAGQVPTLQHLRTPGGKGEDIRPALADANLPQYAGLPIFVSSRTATVDLAPYGRIDEPRLIGRQQQRDSTMIWPNVPDYATFRDQLIALDSPVLVLIRGSSDTYCPRTARPTTGYIDKCLPTVFTRHHYRAVLARPAGTLWTFGILVHDLHRRALPGPASHHAFAQRPSRA